MSIYGSLHAPDDDHPITCAVYVEDPPGSDCYEFSGQPCDCGLKGAPIIYEGSHVLPSDDDPRGGSIDLASIHGGITRDGRDSPGDHDTPHPWLRFGIHSCDSASRCDWEGAPNPDEPYVKGGDATVVLDRCQVEQIHETLTWWLDATKARPASEVKEEKTSTPPSSSSSGLLGEKEEPR